MAGKIFINYRRGDDPGFTQALYQRLEDEFGPENLFMDVEGHIKPGDDFVQVLDAQVGHADIVLAVIGPRWSELIAARSGDADDFVAIEIKSAIDRAKRVVPVLVGGALMPRAEALPEAIRSLARRNAVGLRPERFKADCLGLIAALKEQLTQAERERDASARERAAAEDARRQREGEEAARLEALESRARAQPLEGIDPAQLRKAEELANWQYVGERGTLAELRDHLARYPGGVTERAALLKLEDAAWAALPQAPGIEELRTYLSEFPKAKHAGDAQKWLDQLLTIKTAEEDFFQKRARETKEWLKLATSTDKAKIKAFLKSWPEGQHASAAHIRLGEIRHPLLRSLLLPLLGGAGLVLIAHLFLWLSVQ